MTNWHEAMPAILAAVGLLFAPGGIIGLVMGLRLPAAIGLAPLLSGAVVALAELLNGVGVAAYGPILLGVSLAAALVVAVVVRVLAGAAPLRPDLGLGAVWCLGIGGGFLLATLSYIRGVAVPDEFPQAPDIPYQANHVRWGIETGNVNPFDFAQVGGLGENLRGFYPSLWHGFTVPVAELTGASVPVAINAMDVAMLAVFAAGCVFLANQLITQRTSVTLWSGVLSASFVAFPTFMFTWGGVLPNILAIALYPALLAIVLEWLDQRASSRLESDHGNGNGNGNGESNRNGAGGGRRVVATAEVSRDETSARMPAGLALAGPDSAGVPLLTRPQIYVLLVAAVPTMFLAHPNTVFSAALMLVIAAATMAVDWLLLRVRPPRGVLVRVVGTLVVAPLATVLAYRTAAVQQMVQAVWAPGESVPQSVGQAITNATSTPWVNTAFIPVTALVLGGVIVAMRTRRHWLVTAYVVWIGLYASTQSTDPLGNALSGIWYHDRHRVAAFLSVTSIMLATLGAVTACDRLMAALRPGVRRLGSRLPALRSARSVRLAASALAVVVGLTAFLWASGFGDRETRIEVLQTTFPVGNDNNRSALITRQEQEFFASLGRYVPAGQRIINHGWDGSPLIYALSGVPVVSYSTAAPPSDATAYLSLHADRIAQDPQACAYAKQLNARYVVTSGPLEFANEPAVQQWAGVTAVKPSSTFEVVAHSGQSTLYRIHACGWS
jgi:hypothetical protein